MVAVETRHSAIQLVASDVSKRFTMHRVERLRIACVTLVPSKAHTHRTRHCLELTLVHAIVGLFPPIVNVLTILLLGNTQLVEFDDVAVAALPDVVVGHEIVSHLEDVRRGLLDVFLVPYSGFHQKGCRSRCTGWPKCAAS